MDSIEKGSEKLLLVDDMPINLELLEMMLAPQGFDVSTVRSGQGTLDLAPKLLPDLILLDVMMPGLDGYETCQRLKAKEATRDIPVIFVTAKTGVDDVVRGFEVGAVDYITKPVQQLEVLARVRTHLRTQRLLRVQRKQLVQAERLATLGEMLGECAHEVATPIGTCGTAWSYLDDQRTALAKALQENALKKADLTKFLENCQESCRIGRSSIQRAQELILSFKQVAVDQCAEVSRNFAVKAYLELVLLTLRPKLKVTPHTIQLVCADTLTLYGYPGVYSQIVTNLVLNSLIHAFAEGQAGQIWIEVLQEEQGLVLIYKDNGKGISAENLNKIFQKYFTTRGAVGGSGLGLFIVHDLVTRVLGGTLQCSSVLGAGVEFCLKIPKYNYSSPCTSPSRKE